MGIRVLEVKVPTPLLLKKIFEKEKNHYVNE